VTLTQKTAMKFNISCILFLSVHVGDFRSHSEWYSCQIVTSDPFLNIILNHRERTVTMFSIFYWS